MGRTTTAETSTTTESITIVTTADPTTTMVVTSTTTEEVSTTSLESSRTTNSQGTCKSWCANQGVPWSARCMWSNCEGCSECHFSVSTTSANPSCSSAWRDCRSSRCCQD